MEKYRPANLLWRPQEAAQEVMMSAVIKFPLEKVQRTSTKDMTSGESGKVLVFEGVQYVKQENCDTPRRQANQASRGSKRKK